MRIAVLDDDLDQLELVKCALAAIGHDAHVFADGQSLLRVFRRETFDMLIVDWQLPDISGPEVVAWARKNLDYPLPILFVTNRREERDIVEGLAAGGDDFMSKPTRVGELIARVRAVLRRTYPTCQPGVLRFGRYRINTFEHRIEVDGTWVELKVREYELAKFFFLNVGRLLSRDHLHEAIWGACAETSSRTLDTHVSRLRSRLALRPENGYRLTAVYSVGYRLEAVGASSSHEDALAEVGARA